MYDLILLPTKEYICSESDGQTTFNEPITILKRHDHHDLSGIYKLLNVDSSINTLSIIVTIYLATEDFPEFLVNIEILGQKQLH